MIQPATCKNAEKNANSLGCAATGAAVDAENDSLDPVLATLLAVWPKLSHETKQAVLAALESADVGRQR